MMRPRIETVRVDIWVFMLNLRVDMPLVAKLFQKMDQIVDGKERISPTVAGQPGQDHQCDQDDPVQGILGDEPPGQVECC